MHHRRAGSTGAAIHKSIQAALNNPPNRRRNSQSHLAGSEASDPATDSPSRLNSPSSRAPWSPCSSQPSVATLMSLEEAIFRTNDKRSRRKQHGSERQKSWHEKMKAPANAADRFLSTYSKIDDDEPDEDDESGRAYPYDALDDQLSNMSKTLSSVMQGVIQISAGQPVPKALHPILMASKLVLVTFRAARKYRRQQTSQDPDASSCEPWLDSETCEAANKEVKELENQVNDLKDRSVGDLSEISSRENKLKKLTEFNSQMEAFRGYLTEKGYDLSDDEEGPRTDEPDSISPRHSPILERTGEVPWRPTSPARSTAPSPISLRRGTTIELEERLHSLGPRPLSPDSLRRVQSLQPTLLSSSPIRLAEDSVSSTESEHSTPAFDPSDERGFGEPEVFKMTDVQ